MHRDRRTVLALLGQATLVACARPPAAAVAPPPAPRPEPPMPNPPPPLPAVTVDLVHDVVCPWCRIGHRYLQTALEGWQGPPVAVRLVPFLLEPDLPPEGADLRQRLAAKYGAGRLDAMFARVTQVGQQAGLRFDFDKVRRAPDTTAAHVLLATAPQPRQEALLKALHAAHFERGADISVNAVLLDAWTQQGLAPDLATEALADAGLRQRIRGDAQAASRQGVTGVPHFTFRGPQGRTVAVGGAQPVEVLRRALGQVVG